MKITVDITINAPIKQVYEVFSNIKAAEKNIEGIEKIEILKDTKEFVGTRWKETRTEMGKTATVEMWVTDAKKNQTYEVESVDHGMKYLSRYLFEKVGKDSTKVTLEFTGEPLTFTARLLSVVFFFFKGTTKKLFLKDMQELKKVLEE